MRRRRGPFTLGLLVATAAAVAGLALSACRPNAEALADDPAAATLRIGLRTFTSRPTEGLRQLNQILTGELLANFTEEGRLRPVLARDWTISSDGLGLTVNLTPGVKFHDGSPLTAAVVVKALQTTLPNTMGQAFEDVEGVTATTDQQVVVRFRRPSPFMLDLLEATIQKAGTPPVGTGPFVGDPEAPTTWRANPDYHLGRPTIDRIVAESFPSVRAAWAELLRGRLDMLYEVGIDALDSLETSTSVSISTFRRHYQYIVALNTQSEVFRTKEKRRAVNMGIDRDALVREALNGHGLASTGPVWVRNYAYRPDSPKFEFNAAAAARAARAPSPVTGSSSGLRFTCLIPSDAVYERLGLVMKKQLADAGIEMILQEASQDEIYESLRDRKFEAALIEGVSGPTLLRPYQLWHSKGAVNAGGLGSPAIDEAFDRVRRSASDEEYRQAVAALQQAFVDDPPAVFLAWIDRVRAVSNRFEVATPDAGRDILSTLRLWKPVTEAPRTSQN